MKSPVRATRKVARIAARDGVFGAKFTDQAGSIHALQTTFVTPGIAAAGTGLGPKA